MRVCMHAMMQKRVASPEHQRTESTVRGISKCTTTCAMQDHAMQKKLYSMHYNRDKLSKIRPFKQQNKLHCAVHNILYNW
jgi:hypothetical protein